MLAHEPVTVPVLALVLVRAHLTAVSTPIASDCADAEFGDQPIFEEQHQPMRHRLTERLRDMQVLYGAPIRLYLQTNGLMKL